MSIGNCGLGYTLSVFSFANSPQALPVFRAQLTHQSHESVDKLLDMSNNIPHDLVMATTGQDVLCRIEVEVV
jgi:hypothetical protein